MDRWDWPILYKPGQRLTLPVIEFARLARGLAVNQAIWPPRIEAKNPVADNLDADISDLGCIPTPAAIINH